MPRSAPRSSHRACRQTGGGRVRTSRQRPLLEYLEDRTLLAGHTLASAAALGFRPNNTATASGFLASGQQADLFALSLAPGDQVRVAVAAQQAGSALDSLLRVFDATGRQVASNGNF